MLQPWRSKRQPKFTLEANEDIVEVAEREAVEVTEEEEMELLEVATFQEEDKLAVQVIGRSTLFFRVVDRAITQKTVHTRKRCARTAAAWGISRNAATTNKTEKHVV